MKIKQKWCESCQEYHPLTEEYFYKMKLSPNGFSKICKEAYKKRYCDYRRLRKKLEEENKPIEKFKSPEHPEIKIKKPILIRWKRDQFLRCVVQCRCGMIYDKEFYKRPYIFNCKKCGRNLIIYHLINFLNSKLLFENTRMRKYNLAAFDPWR